MQSPKSRHYLNKTKSPKPKTLIQQQQDWINEWVTVEPYPKIARTQMRALPKGLDANPTLFSLSKRGSWSWWWTDHPAFAQMMGYRQASSKSYDHIQLDIQFKFWDGRDLHLVELSNIIEGGKEWLYATYPVRISSQPSAGAPLPSSETT